MNSLKSGDCFETVTAAPSLTLYESPSVAQPQSRSQLIRGCATENHFMEDRTVRLKFTLALSLLTLLFAFPATARYAAKPKMTISTLEHSFGVVKPGTPLTYTFQIGNQGDARLEVLNVSPSCGCTTSKYDKAVAPGKTGGITLAIEKTGDYKGEVIKTATVTTNDPVLPTFTLTLRAEFKAE